MNASILWQGFGDIEVPEFQKWDIVRAFRHSLLIQCDWTQLPDAPLTLEEKEAWATYRQVLRNIPEDFATPDEVVFPEVPGVE